MTYVTNDSMTFGMSIDGEDKTMKLEKLIGDLLREKGMDAVHCGVLYRRTDM